ncbi:MAG: NADH-quinone oxidoreductase subunit B family protein [Thermoplasmata archaeon]
MTSWIRHAYRRGILTTEFPRVPASEEELPGSGRPPVAAAGALVQLPEEVRSDCPTGAIGGDGIDQGRCIRCARCRPAGLMPALGVELNVGSRDGLRWPDGERPSRAGSEPPPLAALKRSLHLFLIDVGSCQGCNREVLGLSSPYYDLERLGFSFTNSPRHADILVVVGIPTPAMVEPLQRTFSAIPAPKAVLAVGACAIDGGIFHDPSAPSVAELVPVDLFVAGCPPPPIAILQGILSLAGRAAPEREADRP